MFLQKETRQQQRHAVETQCPNHERDQSPVKIPCVRAHIQPVHQQDSDKNTAEERDQITQNRLNFPWFFRYHPFKYGQLIGPVERVESQTSPGSRVGQAKPNLTPPRRADWNSAVSRIVNPPGR
jgi:hypothetical protein